jgi:hypothetical protein
VNRKIGRIAETFDFTNLERCQQQAKSGDSHGVGVEIDSANTIKRPLRKNAWTLARLMLQPKPK